MSAAGRALLFSLWALAACASEVAAPPTAGIHVHAGIERCPEITELTVLPLEVIVGGEIEVSASTVPEDAELQWRASSGSFEDPRRASTVYFCEHGGEHRLSVRALEPGCPQSSDVTVTCSYSPSCGDGRLDFGEECDDGNQLPGDSCPPRCRLRLIEGVE
jgi:cysteine-rich repeat protein